MHLEVEVLVSTSVEVLVSSTEVCNDTTEHNENSDLVSVPIFLVTIYNDFLNLALIQVSTIGFQRSHYRILTFWGEGCIFLRIHAFLLVYQSKECCLVADLSWVRAL